MKVKSDKNSSPFVVDQPGNTWFLYALVLAGLIGFSFRLYFSELRVSKELRLAFAILEPELKLQFAGAKLSLDEGWLWPQVALSISELQGSYHLSIGSSDTVDLHIDEVVAPINFWSLLQGRLELKVLELGHLSIRVPQSSWSQIRNQTLQLDAIPVSSNSNEKHQDEVRSQYQPVVPKPVDRVLIKSIRLMNEASEEWPFELRQIKFDLDHKGRAEIASELFFPYQYWGSLPSLPVFFRWNPEDRFVSVTMSGRFREGHLRLSGTFDFAQDFFNFEFLGRTLPVHEVQVFLTKLSQSQFLKAFWAEFPLRYWLETEWPGWLTLEISSLGYLSQDKSAQLILRNTRLEEGEQRWEIGTLTGNQNRETWSWGPWSLQVQGLSHERAQTWLPRPSELDFIKKGEWQAQLDCTTYFNCLGSYQVKQAQLNWGNQILVKTPALMIQHPVRVQFQMNAEQVEIVNWMQQSVRLVDWNWDYQPKTMVAMQGKKAQHTSFKAENFEGLDFNLDTDQVLEKAQFNQVELFVDSQVPNDSLIWPLKASKMLWQPQRGGQLKLQLIWPNNKKLIFNGARNTNLQPYLGWWIDNQKNKKNNSPQTILNW